MTKWVHHEREGEVTQMVGRRVTWVQTNENTGSKYSQVCTCVYEAGARSKPAHAHPDGEETVYVISGCGHAKIGDNLYDIEPGSVIFFPQNVPHMLWNTGDTELSIVCFYAPVEESRGYAFFEDFDFPEFSGVLQERGQSK
jgi:quercetin dioxygenase-like cupin family protein